MKTNKLKEQLRLKMLGQLSDEKTDLDVNNAYDVAVSFTLSFISFLCENYHTEFETWTRNKLLKGKIQRKEGYDLVDIEEALNEFLEKYNYEQ